MSETVKQEALAAIARGWKVFPLRARSKEPATRHGFYDWTDDPASVEEVWGKYPDFNYGIVCGGASGGLLVLDFDVDGDEGVDSVSDFLRPWEAEHGELPETVTAVTGRGGLHYYYRVDKPIQKAENGEHMEKHLLLTRYDPARAERGDMLKVDDVLEILLGGAE